MSLKQFQDLSDFLKSGLKINDLKRVPKTSVVITKCRNSFKKAKKESKNTLLLNKRCIPKDMSPYNTPGPKKLQVTKAVAAKSQAQLRIEKLAKWKETRNRQKEMEKKQQKPIFKVCHVDHNSGLPKLDMVNKVIKGKLIEFKKHTFNPPKNVRPIYFQEGRVTRSQTRGKIPEVHLNNQVHKSVKGDSVANIRKTKKLDNGSLDILAKKSCNNARKEKSAPIKPTPKKNSKTTQKETSKLKSPHVKSETTERTEGFGVSITTSSAKLADDPKILSTPKEKQPVPVCYVSPFVTISRGKNSARKEFHARKSLAGIISPKSDTNVDLKNDTETVTSPKAASMYFYKILDDQIASINGLCATWNVYKKEEDLPEGVHEMIDVAVGQSQLLINKKFQQFRGLIDRCRNGDSLMPVTCEDLHGFWDMIYMQVINIEKRFENLERLKENSWEEILPQKMEKKRTQVKKKKGMTTSSSGLREAIKAARMQKKNLNCNGIEDVVLETPQVVIHQSVSPELPPTKYRRSMRKSISTTPHKNVRSPGLNMLKVTCAAKFVSDEEGRHTPRSILKSRESTRKSQFSRVFFEEDISCKNATNNTNSMDVLQTPRRSKRNRV